MTALSNNPGRILVVKTHAIGDLLMVTPAIRAVKKTFPNARLDVLTGSWSADAVRYNPFVDAVIDVPDAVFHSRQATALYRLIQRLRSNNYDLGLVFQPSGLVHALCRLAGIRHLAAPAGKTALKLVKWSTPWRQNSNQYVVEDFLRVTESIGIPSDGNDLDFYIPEHIRLEVGRMLSAEKLQKGQYLVMCPGGGRNPRDFVRQKIWPENKYANLAERLIRDNIPVIVAGVESDRNVSERITAVSGVKNWIGRTSFAQLGELLRRARMLLTNDSAPVHLALAVGCPFVCVFGPSRSRALLPKTGRFTSVNADIPCAPCYDNAPFPGCDRNDCIQSVRIDTVYEAVAEGWHKWSGESGL